MDDFDRVFAVIQATEDNTVLTFDTNIDGTLGDTICESRDAASCTTPVSSVTLDEGEVFLLDQDVVIGSDLLSGTTIEGSKTLQVQYVVGDEGSSYEVRGLSAFPRGFWDDEYYAPVDSDNGSGNPTDIYLHNPHSSAININYETATGSGTFTIDPKTSVSFEAKTPGYVPENSAVYLKGSDVFWGVSTIDTEGVTYDWGYSLVRVHSQKAVRLLLL